MNNYFMLICQLCIWFFLVLSAKIFVFYEKLVKNVSLPTFTFIILWVEINGKIMGDLWVERKNGEISGLAEGFFCFVFRKVYTNVWLKQLRPQKSSDKAGENI